jgi:gluconate 2-dehydrogenase gamma chain
MGDDGNDVRQVSEGPRLTRRRLLAAAGGAAATAGIAALPGCDITGGGANGQASEEAAIADANVDAPQLRDYPRATSQAPLSVSMLGFFTMAEAKAVEAFTSRLIPGSPADPGAREAGVTAFIDRKLTEYETFATTTYFKPPFAKPAKDHPVGFDGDTVYVAPDQLPRYGFQSSLTPQQAYRLGLAELDRYSRKHHGAGFAELSGKAQDAIVELLEADKIESFTKPTGKGFFSMLQQDASEGMFSDPIYGGNRDFTGWKLVGYPGAQRAYTPAELKRGPNDRRIQGLREMQAMHPGHAEEHAILPITGTRGTG